MNVPKYLCNRSSTLGVRSEEGKKVRHDQVNTSTKTVGHYDPEKVLVSGTRRKSLRQLPRSL